MTPTLGPRSPSRNDTHAGTRHRSLLGIEEMVVKAQKSEDPEKPSMAREGAWLEKEHDCQEAGEVGGASWWG